jgi:hypothetical protein
MNDVRCLNQSQGIDGNLVQLSPRLTTLRDVAEEVRRARTMYPRNDHMLAALMEEVGELAQAYLQGKAWSEIRGEAIQVACIAIRITEESDADFPDARGSTQ